MNHLSPPLTPHSQKPTPSPALAAFANSALGDVNFDSTKNWIQNASAFNSVIASKLNSKLMEVPFCKFCHLIITINSIFLQQKS